MNKIDLKKKSARSMQTIRKTELALAVSMLCAGQALAACPEQLTAGQDYTATIDCSASHAIQTKVAAGTVTVNSGVTQAGNNEINLDRGGVVLGSASGPAGPASLVALVNNGTIRGGTMTTGIGVNMWSNIGATEITSLTNNGTIAGNVGVLTVNAATIGTLTNSSGAMISGAGDAIRLQTGSVGTIINQGTIQGGSRGIATGDVPITNGIDNSGTITGGTIAGVDYSLQLGNAAGAFTVTNSGTLNGDVSLGINRLDLNGNSAVVNGNVTGSAASLVNVNGTFTSGGTFNVGHFEIASGGVFNMQHDVTASSPSTFANNGTLAVNAGDTVTITGNYTQGAGAVYRTVISDDTTYGKLVVDGDATLASNAKIDVDVADPSFVFTATGFQDIISATSLVSDGTFTVTDNSALFNFSAVKDGDTVDLTLAAASSTGVLDAVTSTGNTPATGAATVLDEVIASDPDSPLASLFVGLTTDQEVSDAVSQTLPLLTGGSMIATRNALTGINRTIQARQDANRGMSSGNDFLGDRDFWVKPFGSWADYDDQGAVPGFESNAWGVALGADTTLSGTTRVGLAFAYAKADVDSNSSVAPQSMDVDVYQLIGYGSHSLDSATEINFQVDAGMNSNNGSRLIALNSSVASSDYDSYSLHAGAGLARTYAVSPRTTVTPSIRADYTWIKEKSYTETGADVLNLSVDGRTTDELVLGVDANMLYTFDDRTSLTARLGVGYDVINDEAVIVSAYAGAPGAAFATYGLDPEPWLGRAGLGLVHGLASGMEITARYDAEFRDDFTNQTASIKARWAF